MEPQANEQRQPLLLFTVITLNTNKLADLAFLPTLLKENRPDFVFLQEVSVPRSVSAQQWVVRGTPCGCLQQISQGESLLCCLYTQLLLPHNLFQGTCKK